MAKQKPETLEQLYYSSRSRSNDFREAMSAFDAGENYPDFEASAHPVSAPGSETPTYSPVPEASEAVAEVLDAPKAEVPEEPIDATEPVAV